MMELDEKVSQFAMWTTMVPERDWKRASAIVYRANFRSTNTECTETKDLNRIQHVKILYEP